MKMPMFRDYDLIIASGVFFLTLISLALALGDRQISPSSQSTVCVAYDKNSTPEEIELAYARIRSELNLNHPPMSHYLGIEGYDIVWGIEAQANHAANKRIPYGVIWMPLLAAVIVVLMVASLRARVRQKSKASLLPVE